MSCVRDVKEVGGVVTWMRFNRCVLADNDTDGVRHALEFANNKTNFTVR